MDKYRNRLLMGKALGEFACPFVFYILLILTSNSLLFVTDLFA